MHYEERLFGFAVAAMALVDWRSAESRSANCARWSLDVAEAMEAEFTARVKARRHAAEQAAKKAREDAANAAKEVA